MKNKEVVRNATNSGSTSAAASTLEPAVQHLRTIQLEQQQRIAAEAKGLPSLALHSVHGSASRALISGHTIDDTKTTYGSVTLTPEVENISTSSNQKGKEKSQDKTQNG